MIPDLTSELWSRNEGPEKVHVVPTSFDARRCEMSIDVGEGFGNLSGGVDSFERLVVEWSEALGLDSVSEHDKVAVGG